MRRTAKPRIDGYDRRFRAPPRIAVDGIAQGVRRDGRASTTCRSPSRPAPCMRCSARTAPANRRIVKLLSGLIEPDARAVSASSARRCACARRAPRMRHGVQTAFQEMTLVPRPHRPRQHAAALRARRRLTGMIRRRCRANAPSARAFRRARILDIDLDAEVGELDLAVQQKIEIARAVYPQAAHPAARRADLDARRPRRRLARRHHRAAEGSRASPSSSSRIACARCARFAITLTILRNGRHIATAAGRRFSATREIIEMIIGRSHRADLSATSAAAPGRSARRFWAPATSPPVGKLRRCRASRCARGEILGVAGLQGMGQLDLFLACFGMTDITAGERLRRRPAGRPSPRRAMRCAPNIGMGLVPEDRKTEALFLKLDGQTQCFAADDRALLPLRPRRQRGARTSAVDGVLRPRRSRPPRAVDAGRLLFRRQPAKDRASPNGCSREAASCCCSIPRAASMSAPSTSSMC